MAGLNDVEGSIASLELEGRLMEGVGASRGKGRGGRGNGVGGGGGGKGREVQISKTLSKLLRHQAQTARIALDEKGYAELEKVMAWQPIRSLKVTLDEIRNIVSGNDKQRFSLIPNPATYPSYSELAAGQGTSTSPADQQNFPLTENPAHYLIRANQGHSIALSSADHLTPLTLDQGNVPQVVVHGTYFAIWPAIVASGGLRPMGRTHIHCATGLPDDAQGVISGMRNDAEVLIYVDVEKCLEDGGMKWWMSENGVVLTEGGEDGLVPIRYFREVVGRCEGVGVLVRDGVQVGELPEGIKMRVPPGRRGGRRGGRGRGRGP